MSMSAYLRLIRVGGAIRHSYDAARVELVRGANFVWEDVAPDGLPALACACRIARLW